MVTWDDLAYPDFQNLYKRIKPLSEYGMKKHHNFELFQKDEEENATNYFSLIRVVYKWEQENKKKSNRIRKHLRSLLDIDSNIKQIENEILREISFYEIRKTSRIINSIKEIIKETPIIRHFYFDINALQDLENVFLEVCQGSLGFYISNSFSDDLMSTRKRIKSLDKEIFNHKLVIYKEISSILGYEVGKRFSVLKENQEIISKLKNNKFLLEVDEDAFHKMYQIKRSSQLEKLEEEKEKLIETYEVHQENAKSKISELIEPYLISLKQALEVLANLDIILAKTKFMREHNCSIPIVKVDSDYTILNGVHPILAERLNFEGNKFTARTINLSSGIAAITGINMGGKTVTLRLIRLLACMVHAGIPVPAERVMMPLFDFVFYSDGSEDTISTGLSKFGQEISSIVSTLKNKNKQGLVCIDELVHGAMPEIGQSIAIAYLEEMKSGKCKVMVTTHYPGISKIKELKNWRTKGLKKEFFDYYKNKDLTPNDLNRYIDYSVELYKGEDSYQQQVFNIAKALGLDKEIIDKAKLYLEKSR